MRRAPLVLIVSLAVLVSALLAPSPRAQCETVALVPFDSGSYAYAVDVADGRALIGDHELFDGLVHVYDHASFGWSYTTTLASSDPDPFTFGFALAVGPDALFVGAPNEDGGHGRVHVFEAYGPAWIETTTLDLQTEAKSALGGRLSADGSLAAAAAVGDSISGSLSGAVHILELGPGGWTLGPKLVADDAHKWARFGTGLDLDGDTLLVGAPGQKVAGEVSGAAYVFERQPDGAWDQVQTLVAPVPAPGAAFGTSLALSGDRLIVGAWLENAVAPGSGQVHAWRREASGDWVPDGTLMPAGTVSGDRVGRDVALDGEVALVSSWGADGGEGRVTVFRLQGGAWTEGPTLVSGHPALSQGFGWDVALSGDLAVIGANIETSSVPGAAFLWGGLAGWADLGGGFATAPDPIPDLRLTGSLCPGQGLTVTLAQAPPLALTSLILGFSVLGQPFAGGTLVPTPDVLLGLLTDSLGEATLATAWPGGLPLGSEVVVQAWVWPSGGEGFSASAGHRAVVP